MINDNCLYGSFYNPFITTLRVAAELDIPIFINYPIAIQFCTEF